MKKDYVGYTTGKIHDTDNYNFSQINNNVKIDRIECYYSEKDGIFGLFPFYKNDTFNMKILKLEDSFYKDFKQTYLPKLKEKLKYHEDKLEVVTIDFLNGEEITGILASYDESKKKITALKIKTNKKNYKIGKVSDLNDKEILKSLHKAEHFIPGFKTCYITEKNDVCFLSYVKVYYEHESNIKKFYNLRDQSKFPSIIDKQINCWLRVMTIISKILFWIILFAFPILFYYYKSQNLYRGELIIPKEWGGLDNPVKIYTDSLGFYHIKAESTRDGFFAIGFLHAKDRLWQMDFNRRVGRGRLSEILGEKSLPIDTFIRSIGLNEMSLRFENDIVESNFDHVSQIGSYIDGINYFANNFILPIEYQIMNVKWENWELADTIGIFNIMTLTLNHDWNMEIWYKMLEESIGKEFADLVLNFRDVDYPFWNETIVNDEELVKLNLHKHRKLNDEIIRAERGIPDIQPLENESNIVIETKREQLDKNDLIIQEKYENMEEKIEVDSKIDKPSEDKPHPFDASMTEIITTVFNNEAASNSWVISGKYTESGFPILANDPHLSNSIPGVFYHLKLYLPNNTLVGSTIPGNPLIFVGSNKNISWGITTENSDTVDICEEKIEDDFYIYEDKKIKITTTKETIFIKNSDPQFIEVKWTRNGPLIKNQLPKELISINLNYKPDTPISLRLPFYYFPYTNLEFFYALNFAEKPSDFLDVSNKLVSPNLNLIYATTNKEIGWTPVGLFPVKNYKNRFCRGYSKEDDIKKYIKREELPILENPDKGFIVTANNKFAHFNYTYNLHGFHNHVRAYRIRQLIEEKIHTNKKLDIKDNMEIAGDLKDSLAENILPKLLKIVERSSKSPAKTIKYFKELSDWDFIMSKESNIPTIWSVLELNIGMRLIHSKVTEQKAKGLISMLHYWNFVAGIIDKIYRGEKVEIKQCALLTGNMNCEKYLTYIFSNLDDYLTEGGFKDKTGRILNWGELKFNHYPHAPLDAFPILNKIFSRRVFTGGNRNTVKISRGPFNHDKGQFISTQSPRMRIISDMKDPTRPFVMLDSGNSGSILNKFYDNLMEKSENIEYSKIDEINFETLSSTNENLMTLK
jgi:penicillin amidase